MRLAWYPDGTENPWRSWYERQNKAVRACHDKTMRFLRAGHWNMPNFSKLNGYDDLYEIRITKGVAHRLVGFRDPESKIFIVAMPCTHKGKQYYPREALDTASRRAKEIKEEQIVAILCEQPDPAFGPRGSRGSK